MKKLFTNDKFFLAVFLVSVIGSGIWVAIDLIFNAGMYFNVDIIYSLMLLGQIGLYISYKKHSKNVMKGLMGALYMALLISAVLFPVIDRSETAVFIIDVVFSFGIMFNHFIINTDHMSSPWKIVINQIAAVVLVLDVIAWAIVDFKFCSSGMDYIPLIVGAIGYSGIILFLVCVESRLDAYRLDREAAGWTEEAGYPEGYIHEYEKK